MKVIIKNNQIRYKYTKNKFSEGVIYSIIFFSIALFLFFLSILISVLNGGNAGPVIAGLVLSSFCFDICALYYIILEIYLFENRKKSVRNMLFLELGYFIFWAFII